MLDKQYVDRVSIAFIMQCHKNPKQINELIASLDGNDIDFYIHIDSKSKNIRDEIIPKKNVYIIPADESINVQWGQISQVRATIELIRRCVNSRKNYDYIWLISGQDYPIKSNNEIQEFLKKNYGKEFIEIKSIRRFEKRNDIYYPLWIINQKKFSRILRRLYVFFTGGYDKTFRLFRRKRLFREYYFGSSWWTLTFHTVKYILKIIDENPEYIEFFKHSTCSDECFFQTILMNSSELKSVFENMLTYVDWSGGGNSPKILNKGDFDKLMSSPYLLARKFDAEIDMEIIKMIDKVIKI